MQNNPSSQTPCKGILKTSRSFDKSGASFRKSAKFDELNVLQTFHPSDKDYGHMKIDEAKTPYNYDEEFDENKDELDTELLVEKLRIAAKTQKSSESIDDDTTEDELDETEDERNRRIEFERRRKAHYREFEAVKLARKLIQEEEDDEDDDDNEGKRCSISTNQKQISKATVSDISCNNKMDIEQNSDSSQN